MISLFLLIFLTSVCSIYGTVLWRWRNVKFRFTFLGILLSHTSDCSELGGRNIDCFAHYVRLLFLMCFRDTSWSRYVLKILRGAVPVGVHRTAFLLAPILFYFLHSVCVCLSVLMLISYCWITLSHIGLHMWLGGNISVSRAVRGRCWCHVLPMGDLTVVNALPQCLWDLSLVPSHASGRVRPAFPTSSSQQISDYSGTGAVSMPVTETVLWFSPYK